MASYDTTLFDRTTPPHAVTLGLLVGLSAMVMNMFLPSMKMMADAIGADYRVIQLTVPAFLASSAMLQLFVGPISDRFGRRPVILSGIVVFLLATLGCIYAPNAGWFLFFRALQASVAIGMTISRAIVRDVLPLNSAASMIGYITTGMAIVPMFAPAIGGLLDSRFGWQASFWAMFAAGVLVLILTFRDLGETAPLQTGGFRDQARQYPVLLTSVRFWGYCFAAALGSGVFFAYLGGASYVGSDLYGLGVAWLGFVFSAPAYGYMAGNFISGRYAARLGINTLITMGTVVTASGAALSFLFTQLGIDTYQSFFGFMILVGLGNGMTIPSATVGMISVRPELSGTASGLGSALMIGGGALLSALAGSVLVPGRGAGPLLLIMLAASLLSVVSIWTVLRRERALGKESL